jgi:uncharacterized protein YdhG (YjbR/CyaY superfamily)
MATASKKRPKTATPPKDIDQYLAAVSDEGRSALERLRKTIRSAAPDATETIGYGVPMFKHQGRPLVSFGASRNHCSFYVMSTEVMSRHAADVEKFDTSPGTIRFPAQKPLPSALVRKLVKARIAEIEEAVSGYGSKRGSRTKR